MNNQSDDFADVAWRIAHAFLEQHVIDPNAEPIDESIAKVMMVGLYAGVRIALVDPELAQAIAVKGNSAESLPFVSVRRGMVRVFGQEFSRRLLRDASDAGFTNPEFFIALGDEMEDARLKRPITEADAGAAVDEVMRMYEPDDERP